MVDNGIAVAPGFHTLFDLKYSEVSLFRLYMDAFNVALCLFSAWV